MKATASPGRLRRQRSRRPRLRLVGLCAVLLALSGDALRGQVIRGVVTDAASDEPVPLVYVGLLAPGRELLVAGLTDARGRFSLTAPSPGSYLLYASRIGYRPVMDGIFEMGEGGMLDVAVGLTPAPVEVEPLGVEVEGRRDLETVGFYERQALGLGHFLEREEIERSAHHKLVDAFVGIPSLHVMTPRAGIAPTELLNPEIRVSRGGDYCSPALYLDGHLLSPGSARPGAPPVRPDDFVGSSEVEGVEIYTRPADTPPAYELTGGCGAVLIWTRVR